MRTATHFIEVVKTPEGIKICSPWEIKYLNWSLENSKKFDVVTIAIFRIYPKKNV